MKETTTYYFEQDNDSPGGRIQATNDQTAIDTATKRFGKDLLVLYRETQESQDGKPFIILYEKPKSKRKT